MILVVKELDGTITEQKIKVTGGDHENMIALRPKLYRHNFPAGSIKLQLLDASKVLIQESETINISSLDVDTGSTGLNFFHGYIRFYLKRWLTSNTEYWLRAVTSGYTFSESAYVGWCVAFEHKKYPELYSPSAGWKSPLDVEIWTINRVIRGTL